MGSRSPPGLLWTELCRAEALSSPFLSPYLHQDSEETLVLSRAAPGARVLPVKVQPIKLVLAQEFDDGIDEGLAVLGSGNHCGEPREQRRAGLGMVEASFPLSLTFQFAIVGWRWFELTWLSQNSILQLPGGSSDFHSCKDNDTNTFWYKTTLLNCYF